MADTRDVTQTTVAVTLHDAECVPVVFETPAERRIYALLQAAAVQDKDLTIETSVDIAYALLEEIEEREA